jgi:hypothetical protein
VALGCAQQLQCYTAANSDLPGNAILSIYVDGSDTAWIGTDNDLTWYANGTFWSNIVAGANWISECTKAPNGAVWCAFYNLAADGGVFRYHNGTLTWYRKNDIAPSYWRTCVLGRSIAVEGNTAWVGLFEPALLNTMELPGAGIIPSGPLVCPTPSFWLLLWMPRAESGWAPTPRA